MSKRDIVSILDQAEELDSGHEAKRIKQSHHASNPQATLLGLPGELRNRIYRFALINPDRIIITATNHTLPPLLRTCRQLRDETTSIHLEENRFGIVIHDHNPQAPLRSSGHWYTKTDYTVSWTGSPNWSNLLRCMKLRYRRELCGAKPSEHHRHKVLSGVAARASRIVKQMRSRGSSWQDIEPVLVLLKEAVEDSHRSRTFWM